jgi:predicted helicase
VIEQYRVRRDGAGQIVSDPNRPDDPEYIVNLIGRVIAVSLRTLDLIAAL